MATRFLLIKAKGHLHTPERKGKSSTRCHFHGKKKSYLVIVGYYHTACFIANVAPWRKLEITVGGIRTLAKAKNEPRREIRTLFQNKLSKTPTLQTSADGTHIY